MEYIESFFVYFFCLYLAVKFAKLIKANEKISLLIYFWHTLFCIIYINYAITNNLDAIGYFLASKNLENFSLYSTGFVRSFNSIFAKYLSLNLVSCFFIFNLIGSLGQILFYKNIEPFIKQIKSNLKYLFLLSVWLPTIHFWTSPIGKDSLIYFFINLSIYCLYKLNKRFLLLLPSLICISLIRPYIGITIFLSISIAVFFKIKVSTKFRLLLRLLTIISFIFFFYLGTKFLNLDTSLNFQNLELAIQTIEYHRGATEMGGSSVDMNSLNPFFRILTYMFRPLFFDAKNIFGIISSIDNFILILIFSYPLSKIVFLSKIKKLEIKPFNLFLLLYSSLTWFLLASTTSNLGIALRHKLMFLPGLIIIVLNLSTNSNKRIYLTKRQFITNRK